MLISNFNTIPKSALIASLLFSGSAMANNRNFEIVNERVENGVPHYDFVCSGNDEQFSIQYSKTEITVVDVESCSDQVMDKTRNFTEKLNNICQCLSNNN